MSEKMALIEMEMEQLRDDIKLYNTVNNKEGIRAARKQLFKLSDELHEAKLEWIRTR